MVLDLTRSGMDSRAFEALASGLLAKTLKTTEQPVNATVQSDGLSTTLFTACLTTLTVDSNFMTRGRPRPKRKGFNDPKGNTSENFFETTMLGLERFGEAVRKHPRLHTLSIRKNALGLDGSRRLARILGRDTKSRHTHQQYLRTLTSLDLSSNGTKNKGIAAVRDLTLGNGAVLKSLNMTHNSIDQAGIHSFFEPPKRDIDEPRTLRTLILRQNYFTLESVQTLMSALRSPAWARLPKLDVSFCALGDIGSGLLANLLKTNVSLTSLHLKGCHLTDNGVKFRGALELVVFCVTKIDMFVS